MKKIRLTILVLLMLLAMSVSGFAAPYSNYSFTFYNTESAEPQAYNPEKVITGLSIGSGMHFKDPDDIFVKEINGKNRIYIADTGNNRIVILDENFQLINEINSYEQTWTKGEIKQKWPSIYNELFSVESSDENEETAAPDNDEGNQENENTDAIQGENAYIIQPELTSEATNGDAVAATPGPEDTANPDSTVAPDGSEEPVESPADTEEPKVDDSEKYTGILPMSGPQGVFVDDNGNLIVCDTDNNALVFFDFKVEDGVETYTLNKVLRETTINTILSGNSVYSPSKVILDNSGRIYVIALNNLNGIMQIDDDGKFVTYIGANYTQSTAWQIFVRTVMPWLSNQTTQIVPTEYSNFMVDKDGFIYGTVSTISWSDLSSHMVSKDPAVGAPIRKLNASGTDILRRLGNQAPVGDVLALTNFSDESKFRDVAIDDEGNYTCLDATRGKAFTYDDSGNLLFVFGGLGNVEGTFEKNGAESIALINENEYLILDKLKNVIVYFKPTTQGLIILDAVKAENNLDYDLAKEKLEEYLTFSSNSEVTYTNIGTLYLQEGNTLYTDAETRDEAAECFKKSMEAYKMGQYRTGYSKAFTKYRTYVLSKYIPTVLTIVIIAIPVLYITHLILKKKKVKTVNGGTK